MKNVGEEDTQNELNENIALETSEKELIVVLSNYPSTISLACKEKDPSVICNYLYQVARHFNKFYTECNITLSKDESRKMRVSLCKNSLHVLKHGLNLLGIETPERM